MNKNLVDKYRLHPFEVMRATAKTPDEFQIHHKSTHGLAVWSVYLFELAKKIQLSATPEQVEKYHQLLDAYVNITNDCSHVNRLEYLIGIYQHKMIESERELKTLKEENKKLVATLAFNEGK